MSEPRIILDLCGGTGAWSRPYAEAGPVIHGYSDRGDEVVSMSKPVEPSDEALRTILWRHTKDCGNEHCGDGPCAIDKARRVWAESRKRALESPGDTCPYCGDETFHGHLPRDPAGAGR
jgi:hypothetical protein